MQSYTSFAQVYGRQERKNLRLSFLLSIIIPNMGGEHFHKEYSIRLILSRRQSTTYIVGYRRQEWHLIQLHATPYFMTRPILTTEGAYSRNAKSVSKPV